MALTGERRREYDRAKQAKRRLDPSFRARDKLRQQTPEYKATKSETARRRYRCDVAYRARKLAQGRERYRTNIARSTTVTLQELNEKLNTNLSVDDATFNELLRETMPLLAMLLPDEEA